MSDKATFRALRDEVGYTQDDLARAMNVSVGVVKRWEEPRYEAYEPTEEALALLLEELKARKAGVSMVEEARRRTGCPLIAFS
jgi:DNA-binding transcriptional regulator YiaG